MQCTHVPIPSLCATTVNLGDVLLWPGWPSAMTWIVKGLPADSPERLKDVSVITSVAGGSLSMLYSTLYLQGAYLEKFGTPEEDER